MMNKPHFYVIASGSNRRHVRHGTPARVVYAAHRRLEGNRSIDLIAEAPIVESPAMGPAKRRFANSALWIATDHSPPALIALLKKVERDFGRRNGRRWGDRVLDLDIILWSGGMWSGQNLSIPHPEFRNRPFVLNPITAIVPDWRDPVTARSVRQLTHLLDRPRHRH